MTLAAWVLAAIRAVMPAGVVVYDRQVPDTGMEGQPPERYVVVWMPGPDRRSSAVSGQSTDRVTRWQTTCVAPDRERSEWLSNRVCGALVDQRPVVEGWTREQIRHLQSYMANEQQPEVHDLVLARQRVSIMDRFELTAVKISVSGS